MRLNPDLPPSVMRQRVCQARRREEQCAHEVAFYLDVIEKRRFYLAYGFSSIHDFARAELGLEKRQVRERLRLVRALENLPRLRKAFLRGKVTFSAVREITRVATPASEAGWIRAAATHSAREIERLVATSREGEVPPRPRLGLPRNDLEVAFRVTPEQMALIETVCARESDAAGRDLDMAEVVLRGIRGLYETEPGIKEQEQADPRTTHGGSSPRKQRRPRPELITIQCRTCREAAVATRDGFVASRPEHVEAIVAAARVRDVSGAETMASTEGDEGLDSTPETPDVPPEKRDLPTSAELRDLVLARDGHQCTFPGCTERENLHAHHVRWRRHGGRTTADNLTTACGRHHGSAHDGTIRIEGTVSSGLRFFHRDGTPLEEPSGMTHVGYGSAPDPELEAILAEDVPEPTTPGQEAPEPAQMGERLFSLDDIPASIDATWWRRFGGLFEWTRNKRTLRLRPGIGQDERPEPNSSAGLTRGEKLSDLVGHADAIARLEAVLNGARATGEVPAAILLTGMAGLGKTTLAHACARESGTPLHATHGGTLDDPTSLLGLLAGLGRGHVLFIDEAHAVPRQVLEFLYTAIEGRYVDILVAQGTRTREVRLELEPFTLITATTDEGRLPQPLMSRFDLAIELDPFADAEMERLLEQTAAGHGIELQPLARKRLVQASRGIPRRALSLVAEAERASRVRGGTRVELVDVHQALSIKGLDVRGLSRVERKILELLRHHGRPMGLEHLAARLGKTVQAILELYEPELLRAGLIERTRFGRKIANAVRGQRCFGANPCSTRANCPPRHLPACRFQTPPSSGKGQESRSPVHGDASHA